MYQYKTLELETLESLCDAINDAFSDYVVSVFMTPPILAHRFKQYNVSLRHSVGAFSDGMLVGFIINSYDNRSLFNSMTGVCESYRGHHLFKHMMEYLIELDVADSMTLEVITENHSALNLYKRNGFRIVDTLHIFELAHDFEPQDTKHDFIQPHTLIQSYGNTLEVIERIKDSLVCIHTEDALCYIQKSGNIIHTKTRSITALLTLYKRALQHYKLMTLQNVSSQEVVIINALLASGAQEVMSQYLMTLDFNNPSHHIR